MEQDLYKILQVDPDADTEVIEAAYKRLARRYHPDLNHAAWAVIRMRELNTAYETLRSPRRRALYDRARWSANGATRPAARRGVARCHRHVDFVAVQNCDACGAALCADCADRFQPPTCTACVVRWARRRQFGDIVVLMAIAMVIVVVGGVAVWAAGRVSGLPRVPLGFVALDLPATVGVLCSAAIAVLVGRAVWDLRRLREVVAEALSNS